MVKRALLLTTLLLLGAGCAGVTAPIHWTADPQGQQATTLPIYRWSENDETLLVEVEIPGQPTKQLFTVTTWRRRTTISLDFARRLGYKIRATTETTETQSEEDRVWITTIPELRVGDLVFKDFTVQVKRERFASGINMPKVPGRLGMDIWRYFTLTYDREKELLHVSRGEPLGIPPGAELAQTCSAPETHGSAIDLEDLGYDPGDDWGEGLWAGFDLGASGLTLIKGKYMDGDKPKYEGKPAEFGPAYFSATSRPGWYIREKGEMFYAKEFEFLDGLTAREVFVNLRLTETFWGGGWMGTDIWPDYYIVFDYRGNQIRFYKRPQVGTRVTPKLVRDHQLEILEPAVKQHPDDAYLQRQWASALWAKGRLDEALAAFEKLVELDPDKGLYFDLLGDILFDVDRDDEALAAWEKSVAVDASRPGPLSAIAWRRFRLGEQDKAKQAADKLIAQWDKIEQTLEDEAERAKKGEEIKREFIDDPDRLDVPISRTEAAYHLLARLAYEKGDAEKTIRHCREAVKLRGEHGDCRFLMALQYIKNDQIQPALDQWDFWLSYNHGNVKSTVYRARKNGILKRLKDRLEWMVKRTPEKVGLYLGLARIAWLEGDLARIESLAKQVEETNSDSSTFIATAAGLYRTLGKGDKVLELIDRWEAFRPERREREAALDRASLHLLFDRFEEAEKHIAKAMSLAKYEEQKKSPIMMRAYIAQEQEDWARAVELCQKRLEIDPDPDGIRYPYARALVNAGKLDEAKKILEGLMKDERDDLRYELGQTGDNKNDVAWGLFILGENLDEALKLAQEAVEDDPRNPNFHDTVAWIELKMGNKAGAAEAWNKAKELEPWEPCWDRYLKKTQ